ETAHVIPGRIVTGGVNQGADRRRAGLVLPDVDFADVEINRRKGDKGAVSGGIRGTAPRVSDSDGRRELTQPYKGMRARHAEVSVTETTNRSRSRGAVRPVMVIDAGVVIGGGIGRRERIGIVKRCNLSIPRNAQLSIDRINVMRLNRQISDSQPERRRGGRNVS